MNKRLKELYKNVLASSENMRWNIEDAENFAKLIVKEHLRIMKTEWYELNNMPVDPAGESPREVGMRIGRKGEVIALMGKIKKHFGVEE